MNTPPLADGAPERKKRGCLFYGCLIVLIMTVILGVGMGVGVWYVAKTLRAALEQFTDTAPIAINKSTMSDGDYTALEARVAAFGEALKAGRVPEPLVLGADDLNALLARNPSMSTWKDRVEVMLEGGQVRARVSMPLDQFGETPLLKALRGRYLNGEAALEVGMVGGQLDVRMRSLQVKGQGMPAEVMQALSQQNLAEAANQDPGKAAFLQKLGVLSVKDGQLVVAPKQ